MSALFCLFLCFRSYPEKLEVYNPTFYKINYILEELYVAVIWIISRLIIYIDQLNTGVVPVKSIRWRFRKMLWPPFSEYMNFMNSNAFWKRLWPHSAVHRVLKKKKRALNLANPFYFLRGKKMELLHSNTRDCIWITKTEKNSSGEAQIWNDKVPLSKQNPVLYTVAL